SFDGSVPEPPMTHPSFPPMRPCWSKSQALSSANAAGGSVSIEQSDIALEMVRQRTLVKQAA
ncbi:hypothetical protein, partial [Mesorhizobium sp. M7A.F.Ca.AU.001.01.1.1]|uniref:hypothetical protein n=1 Tax=Mesorhizobium sp. M7A.F.Ca.AU.001.01.1.1 TaxID=2496675 RepID=UPI0019D4D621